MSEERAGQEGVRVAAPKFARVDIDTLRALRKLAENEPALADKLDHLIEAAEERAWPL